MAANAGRAEEASAVLQSLEGADGSEKALAALREGLLAESSSEAVSWRELFQPSMRLVLILA